MDIIEYFLKIGVLHGTLLNGEPYLNSVRAIESRFLQTLAAFKKNNLSVLWEKVQILPTFFCDNGGYQAV